MYFIFCMYFMFWGYRESSSEPGVSCSASKSSLLLHYCSTATEQIKMMMLMMMKYINSTSVGLLFPADGTNGWKLLRRSALTVELLRSCMVPSHRFLVLVFIGPIIWGHSGPLCHALSLSLSWTSMRRRRATVAACNSSDAWWMAM